MAEHLEGFPQLAKWINDRCANHNDPVVRDSGSMLEYCFALDLKISDTYGWRFSDEDSLRVQLSSTMSAKERNRLYWVDQMRNVEAYSIMSFWRGVELLKSAIRCLNVREVISPSVLTRSAIEIACAYLWNANTLSKTFEQLEFPNDTVVVSSEVEAQIVKMIWGTRLGEPEPYLKQTNIQTIIEKVAKNPAAKDVLTVWQYLCDIAHPNVVGNTRFWSHIANVYPDGSQQRVLSRLAQSQSADQILDRVLWGLGWSAAVLRNSFEINGAAIQGLLAKVSTAPHTPPTVG
jgi:hypothetical protein